MEAKKWKDSQKIKDAREKLENSKLRKERNVPAGKADETNHKTA